MTRQTVQVTVKSAASGTVLTIAQFADQESADGFMAGLRGCTFDVATGPVLTEQVPAKNLAGNERLADGTMILHMYFGIEWVRVTGWLSEGTTGRIVRRRYRYDQLVKIEAR